MAQEGTNNNALPAANFASMGSGGENNGEGTGESQDGNQPVAADKGKCVAAGNVDEGGSKGKSTATAAASSTNAPNQGRAGGGGGRSRERMHIFAERERRRKIKNMFTDLRDLVPTLTTKADKATIVGEAISFIRGLEETVADLERRKRERDSLAARCARLGLGGSSSSAAVAPPPAAAVVPPAVTPVIAHGGSMPAPPVVLPPAGADGGGAWAPALPEPAAAAVTAAPAPAPGTFMVWAGPSVVLNLCGGDQAFINVSVPRRPGVLTMIVEVLERHSIDVVTAQIASDQSRSLFTIHTRVDRERGLFMDTATSEEIYQLAVSEIMVWLHSD
ncbi:hypothetical protein E2562_022781 [Oryza meyeriana var. granulata]|uniref:BHLH domain-containing protein n=1 Tax=Oryza meyeriana var. granulata TaxID=110450 RepID=A0A6G1FB66_9ORYZ|nr:hypothetical protein E2562_022781 [Oryza meyeriana var. granulata]